MTIKASAMLEKETVDKLLALPLNPVDDSAFSESDKQFIDWLYFNLVGKHVRQCSCRNRYADAYYECVSLNSEIKEVIKMKSNRRKYRLIPGYVIYYKGNHYSGVNITDEIAKEYLEEHPDSAKMFEIAEDDLMVAEAEKFLEESETELKDAQPKLTDESVDRIVACQNTLRECIEGGDVENIVSASLGLKAAWYEAEAKPVELDQDPEGEETEQETPKKKSKK